VKLAAIAFTEQGMKLGERIRSCTDFDMTLDHCDNGMLATWTSQNFNTADALLFLGSTGIAVRAIAPYVQSKTQDPAVVVMDELGTYAIPILSGHIGGANKLALTLARYMGAKPVITTATDIRGVFAVDTWAKDQGLIFANPERIKLISARLLNNETIGIKSVYSITGNPPDGVMFSDENYDVLISHQKNVKENVLQLIPQVITVGIGCKKGVQSDAIEDLYERVLQQADCHALAVCRVCSIAMKANEPGILEFCRRRGLPFETFSASALATAQGEFITSTFVESITGIDNVCERAAVLGSGGRLFTKKEACCGVTIALAIQEPKLHFEEEA
jgi:cobalt-precorrin 5A hydrolase